MEINRQRLQKVINTPISQLTIREIAWFAGVLRDSHEEAIEVAPELAGFRDTD